nr:unnamed protein product [Digitaria exilis]
MAIPSSSDRSRRPFLLSLSLFLFISAALVLLFLFLDPSPGSLAFLPSRLSASASAPPLPSPRQQSLTPTATRGSPPDSQPAGPLATAEADEASQPPAEAEARGGGGVPGAGDDSGGARSVEAPDGKTDTSVAAAAGTGGDVEEPPLRVRWETCSRLGRGVSSTDYIPCLDNVRAIKALRSRRHMEHRERHCPVAPRPRCLVPLPFGYRTPVPWPRSRDMVRTSRDSFACLCRYAPLDSCILATDVSSSDESWPVPWPERLNVRYASVPGDSASNKEAFDADTKYWKQIVSEVYFSDFPLNWSSIRNIMDMNAGFGG